MTVWNPVLEPRAIPGGHAQTIRTAVTNETGHDVTLTGRTIRVLPDGVTTSRRRSYIISEAPTAAHVANRAIDRYDPQEAAIDPVTYLIGALVVAGATNIELDGQPILHRTPATVTWRVDCHSDGDIRISRIGDGT